MSNIKTGAEILAEYKNQSFATCQLSLEEMIDGAIASAVDDSKVNRDKLLAALKLCASVCAGESLNKNSLVYALEKARAVLEEIEGKP